MEICRQRFFRYSVSSVSSITTTLPSAGANTALLSFFTVKTGARKNCKKTKKTTLQKITVPIVNCGQRFFTPVTKATDTMIQASNVMYPSDRKKLQKNQKDNVAKNHRADCQLRPEVLYSCYQSNRHYDPSEQCNVSFLMYCHNQKMSFAKIVKLMVND